MIDLDYSFIRLRDNRLDALNMSDSPLATICYNDQIRLATDEPYVQVSNSPTDIIFNDNYEIYLIDACGKEVLEVTQYMFIDEFIDTNGIKQIKWEFVNQFEYYTKELAFRFKNTVNDDTWYTNLFLLTDYEKEFTNRFDYKGKDIHDGTHFERADIICSIRLKTYYRNKINESERSEYHQISTGNTVSQRNVKKFKDRYILETINEWVNIRLESLVTCKQFYIDCVRCYSTTPIEFNEPELDSNIYEGEMIVNKDYLDLYEFSLQIYGGLNYIGFKPIGTYLSGTNFVEWVINFNEDIILNTGTVKLYDSSNTLLETFTETDISVNGFTAVASLIGTSIESPPNDTYYFHITSGLFTGVLGESNIAISDNTTWTFKLLNADYSAADYSSDYFIGEPNPIVDNLTMFYKFNETSGTTATDSEGSNDGTITNVNINQTGLIDKCYEFNNGSTDEYVTIPDSEDLSFGSNPFSIEIWVNPSANFGRILNKYNATTGDLEYRLFLQSGVLQFFIYTDASNRIGIADNATISTGSWQQIIVSYDGSGNASGLKMAIDNVDASFNASETGTFTGMPNTTQPLILGQQSDDLTGTNRYSGKMDILRVWKNYELTDEEKTDLYNSGNGTEN